MTVTCIRRLYLGYGGIVRNGHHKTYPVHSEYVAKMVDFKRRSILYQNQWEAMEARLRQIKELVGKPEQPPTIGLIQQISALQETFENLKEELPQFVEKGLLDDAKANCERIETWEVLKKELKDQFLPCNTSWIAREFLRNLKHTGTVCEFVKEFRSLMLDVRADRLDDFKVANDPKQRNGDSGEGKEEFGMKFKKKEKAKKVVIETSKPRTTTNGTLNWLGQEQCSWERSEVFCTNTRGVVLLIGLATMKLTPEDRSEMFLVEDLKIGNRGSYEDCSRVSSAADPRAYEDCIIDMTSGGYVMRHGHHKLYSVHLEYVERTVNSKGGSVSYQSGISNRWEAMEVRLRRIEELVDKPEQLPTVGLIQQISAPQETNRKFEDEGEGGIATIR
ncbi:UNVERIFIED_CONTAM: hypothetical protein Scaly_2838400 [Sesamum calycinum]|uniref:Retrotransposon gag domain-containing protein n=1 Tax=Sesamum calycinum TaxID=2727403 RepID=A0AAW2IRR0_9LAMI